MASYYELLGVAKTASVADIRKAYAGLAREKHPDRFPDPQQKSRAQQSFQAITAAFNALTNEKSRAEYDKTLEAPSRPPIPEEIARDAFERGQKVYRMNTAEKVIAALKESREMRAILVRDPNRIVSSAVLGSPKLTEPEIESFAGMRGVSSEILRTIAGNKDWTKRYGVISNLVKNPRSPLPIALNLIPRLNPRDLKTISVDRNVPEAIRKHALKFVRGPQGGKG